MTTAVPAGTGGRTVTVHGNSMMPLYRHGDQLIVSDKVPITVGDRIFVETREYGTLGGTLLHRNSKCIALMVGGRARKDVLVDISEVEFLGRIVWASQ